MPTNTVKKWAKEKGMTVKAAEKKWNKAKNLASDRKKEDNYAYTMGIYKKLMKKESFGLSGIKKFEHFDTEDMKSKFELKELQGLIDYKSIVANPSGLDKESDFAVLHDKLAHFHPFLEQCTANDNDLCGTNNGEDNIFKYWFDNGDWFVGMSIEKKSTGIYDCSIMFKSSDLEPTEDNMIPISGPYREDEYFRDRVIIEDYEGSSFKGMVDEVIGVGLKDLLGDLGMSNFLHSKIAKEMTQIHHN
jgi:hypothetical protein